MILLNYNSFHSHYISKYLNKKNYFQALYYFSITLLCYKWKNCLKCIETLIVSKVVW